MSTVIDELVIQFGLDGSRFSAQADKANKDVKKLSDESVKNTKKAEDGLVKLGKGIVEVQKYALGMMSALVGATGLTQFTAQIISAEAALGRLSDHTGQATQSLQAMGNIAELMGGKAEEAFGSAQRFADEMARFKNLGEVGAMANFTTRMGVRPIDEMGGIREYHEVLLDIAGAFEKSRLSKNEFFTFAKEGGIDAGTIDAMMKGRAELEKLFKQQEKVAKITYEQAKAARELQRQWVEMKQKAMAWGYELFNRVRPYLEEFLHSMQQLWSWLETHKDFVIGALTALAVVLTATFLPAIVAVTAAIAPVLLLALAIGLLWEDYQVWKNGGDSLIDWDKWSAEINPAIKAVTELKDSLLKLFDSVDGKEKLANTLKAIANTLAQEFSELLNMITNVATALDYVSKGEYLKAAYVLGTTYSNKHIAGMTNEDLAKPVPTDKLAWDLGIFGSLRRIGDAALEPFGMGSKTNDASLLRGGDKPKAPTKDASGLTNEKKAIILQSAKKIGVDPNHLAAIMSFETAGTFSPGAKNKGSSATGLIQFMEGSGGTPGKYYGMSRDHFASLSFAEQMQYVERYFLDRGFSPDKKKGLGDVYDAVAGYGYKRGSKAYEKNKVWDVNDNGVVEKGEAVNGSLFRPHIKNYFGSTGSKIPPSGALAQAALSQGAANKSVTNHNQTTISGVNIYTTGDGKKVGQDFAETVNSIGINPYMADTGMN